MKSFSSGRMPPVSMMRMRRPRHSASPYSRSRVIPGSSPTMARRDPTIRLNSVDFPTLGRPTMAMVGTPTVAGALIELELIRVKVSTMITWGQPRAAVPTCAAIGFDSYYRDSVAPIPQPASAAAPSVRKHEVSLYQFFAPGGVLSRTHPAYEFRRGQLQMAQSVEQALEEKRHLIVEAGTGTGKTLAYLVPVIRSGKRVIISTGTKNLQEQLFYKDIPFLEQTLFGNHAGTASAAQEQAPGRLSVCYMKGRNNYLCRKKLYDLTNEPVLSGLEEIEQYRAIAAWEKTTSTGDRAELAELPEASALWHKLDARADACIGQKCSEWERCFVTEMRRRGMESDIIIVNHHLFFADLAIKLQADGAPDAGILPEAAAVIFDEAHELEDVAGNYFWVFVGESPIGGVC